MKLAAPLLVGSILLLQFPAEVDSFGNPFSKWRKNRKDTKTKKQQEALKLAKEEATHSTDVCVKTLRPDNFNAETLGAFCTDIAMCERHDEGGGSTWMGKYLKPETYVVDVVIPGTHDTYSLNKNPEKSQIAGVYNKIRNKRKVAKKWETGKKGMEESDKKNIVITQVLKLKQQLDIGIRVLDVRLVGDLEDGKSDGTEPNNKKKKKKKFGKSQKSVMSKPVTIRMAHNHIMMPYYLNQELDTLFKWMDLPEHSKEFVIFKYKAGGKKLGVEVEDVQQAVTAKCQEHYYSPPCSDVNKCDKANKCVFETRKNSGTWNQATVGQLQGKIVFWPKELETTKIVKNSFLKRLRGKGKYSSKTTKAKQQVNQGGKNSKLQEFNPVNFAKYGYGVNGKHVNDKLSNYFRDAWSEFNSRKARLQNKQDLKTSMFYLSSTLGHENIGPICLATGTYCDPKGNGKEETEQPIYGLNNMMMATLTANENRKRDFRGLGLVMMDFPGPQLVQELVKLNDRPRV